NQRVSRAGCLASSRIRRHKDSMCLLSGLLYSMPVSTTTSSGTTGGFCARASGCPTASTSTKARTHPQTRFIVEHSSHGVDAVIWSPEQWNQAAKSSRGLIAATHGYAEYNVA